MIHEDGAIDAYYAYPVDDSWGDESLQGSSVTTSTRTRGNGFMRQNSPGAEIAFSAPWANLYHQRQGAVLMRRGDKNPSRNKLRLIPINEPSP